MGKIKDIKVVSGDKYDRLTTEWCWNTPSGRVWKCRCKCGATCYVREMSLTLHIVHGCPDCDAKTFLAKKAYRKTLPKHRKRLKPQA